MVEKIHIIGAAGSGKTTLAKQLANCLNCLSYDLDLIGWHDHQKVPLSDRMNVIGDILGQTCWITEGVFLWWIEPLLENADLIVWLDIPFRIAAWRIIKRHILASLRGNNPHAGFLNLVAFLNGVYQGYYRRAAIDPESPDDDFAITRAGTAAILAGYCDKVVHCQDQRDAERILLSMVS